MPAPPTEHFTFDGHRLAYDVRGAGDRTVILIPGLLTTRRMQWPLADELAATGHRVFTFDPLGFGESDRPTDYWHYSMPQFAEQLRALLDHLCVDRTVILGTSMGSAIALAFAANHPERLRGLIVEGPPLDRSMAGALPFAASFLALATAGRPLARALARLLPPPAANFQLYDILIDIFRPAPEVTTAVIAGMGYGQFKLPKNEREAIDGPALVIGYRWFDPIHRLADARLLATEIPGARLLHAQTWLELRHRPQRLAPQIAAFLAECAGHDDSASTGTG